MNTFNAATVLVASSYLLIQSIQLFGQIVGIDFNDLVRSIEENGLALTFSAFSIILIFRVIWTYTAAHKTQQEMDKDREIGYHDIIDKLQEQRDEIEKRLEDLQRRYDIAIERLSEAEKTIIILTSKLNKCIEVTNKTIEDSGGSLDDTIIIPVDEIPIVTGDLYEH